MRGSALTRTTATTWRSGHRSGSSSPDDDYRQNRNSGVPPWPTYPRLEENGGSVAPWRLFEERVRTGPFGLVRFPSQPYSPARILVLDPGIENRVNPRLTQFIRDSPPRIRGEWQQALAPAFEEPGLTDDEFKKAMNQIKKQVYNPYRKKKTRKRGLFGRSSNTSTGKDNEDVDKDEGKDCIICLEAFVASEQVLVTPCNHMFHNNCLVPWIKSHGKCPVCRFVLCERRESASSLNSSNIGHPVDAEFAAELISLLRAMDEAFNWVNLAP